MADRPANPLTDDELAAMRARVEKATPGPWQARFIYRLFEAARNHRTDVMLSTRPEADWPDAEFVAAARADVPKLLAEVERLRRMVRELDEVLTDREESC